MKFIPFKLMTIVLRLNIYDRALGAHKYLATPKIINLGP